MGFRCGIVGLPNVGKSTLFNALTETAAAQAANYPFCTIEPNVGRVAVPDERLDKIAAIAKSAQEIETQIEFVDIAGLVRGASQGEGLGLAFRSVAIPLTAIAVNLLSVGAAYGILVLVFQKGVAADLLGFTQVERIDAWIPIFLFSVLFGLSMDYQVFLVSRIHERWSATGDTAGAIVHGVASTARLITGAAAIIVVVFSGFATGQLVAFQEMGFGIAIALVLDATLVRLLLIPAAMRLLGERNWYLPRRLEWLPDLRVEGPPPMTGSPDAPQEQAPNRPPAIPVSA